MMLQKGEENLGKAEGRSIPSCGAESISIYHRAGPEDTLSYRHNETQHFVPPATSTDSSNRLQLNGHQRYVLDAPLSHKHQRRPSVDRNTDSTDPNPTSNHVEKPANQDPKGQQREQTKSALPLTPQQRILDIRQPRRRPGLSARPGNRAQCERKRKQRPDRWASYSWPRRPEHLIRQVIVLRTDLQAWAIIARSSQS